MNKNQTICYVLIVSTLSACASTPNYLPAPSAKANKQYQREQIASPASKQIGGAMISGILGGLLGPLGAIVTGVGTAQTQKMAITSYWKSISNTELVGEIVEDVSKKRIGEYLNNPKWFKNLPEKSQIPNHYSVDFGSGNLIMLPVAKGVKPQVGDVVKIYSPATAWRLTSLRADFNDLPTIVEVLCKASDASCKALAQNEAGVLKRLGEPSAD